MSASSELNIARKNLQEVLGDGMKLYLQILQSWFKQKITRSDFDHEARKLLSEDTVHLHNQFLLAILTKCQSLGSALVSRDSSSSSKHSHQPGPARSPKKPRIRPSKGSKPKATFQNRFLPADPVSQTPQVQLNPPEPDEKAPGYMSRDRVLPDMGMLHGRLIITAWDFGLEDVSDNAVRLLMQAVQMQLKNILTVVMARRNAYKLRERHFRYAMGAEVPQQTLRNATFVEDFTAESEATAFSSLGAHMPSIRPSVETGCRDAAVQLSCAGDTPPAKPPISLFDLYDALQIHKSSISSHTVYCVNMERIINRLWHPSEEDLIQEQIHRQETTLKRDIQAQQSSLFRT